MSLHQKISELDFPQESKEVLERGALIAQRWGQRSGKVWFILREETEYLFSRGRIQIRSVASEQFNRFGYHPPTVTVGVNAHIDDVSILYDEQLVFSGRYNPECEIPNERWDITNMKGGLDIQRELKRLNKLRIHSHGDWEQELSRIYGEIPKSND